MQIPSYLGWEFTTTTPARCLPPSLRRRVKYDYWDYVCNVGLVNPVSLKVVEMIKSSLKMKRLHDCLSVGLNVDLDWWCRPAYFSIVIHLLLWVVDLTVEKK